VGSVVSSEPGEESGSFTISTEDSTMPHELDTNAATGRRAMFSVNETPWHREGVILANAPTLEEAMVLAGANYEVELRDLYVNAGDANVRSPMGKAVIRTDRDTVLADDVLGIVGDGYRPLQNRDAFEVLKPLLDKGVASLETGGVLRAGRDAWMLVRFDIKDPVVQEAFTDEVIPFGLITNNHSAEARALVMQTPIRVVCANTLGQALVGWKDRSDTIAVSHRGDARVRLIEAAERLFGSIVERYRVIAEQYTTMKQTILDVEEFTRTVLDVASPLPKELHTPEGEHLTTRGYDLAYAAAEKRRSSITERWVSGIGHVGDHSAWEAYNGAVEVIDHDSDMFRVRGSRVASLISGRLIEKKSRVLDAVVRLCRDSGRGDARS
jgi:phage/plasmid-like protein (TIGR03299 family)